MEGNDNLMFNTLRVRQLYEPLIDKWSLRWKVESKDAVIFGLVWK